MSEDEENRCGLCLHRGQCENGAIARAQGWALRHCNYYTSWRSEWPAVRVARGDDGRE